MTRGGLFDTLILMSDVHRPVGARQEAVYFATAKPPKENPRPGSGIARSIDSVIDGLDSFNTIHSSKVSDLAKQIERNTHHLDSTKKLDVERNLLLLRKEMDALEVIEVTDALATIDSPWGELAQEIAESDRLKHVLPDKKSREQYVDKLLFPLGAELFRDIRSMTLDPLTRQLMFQSIGDEIQQNKNIIHLAQESLPLPKDAKTVKLAMRRVSIILLGGKINHHESEAQIDTLYKKYIHQTVLRSRLSAEQPLFDVVAAEHALEEAKQKLSQTVMPFAKEAAAQSTREKQTERNEAKRLRQIIDRQISFVNDESSLMQALDQVQHARFEGTEAEIAPYKLEPWVPKNIQGHARSELERLSAPKEDIYAKVLKKLDETERRFRSSKTTWGEKQYKTHMKWLADSGAQASHKQRIINIIDLLMTMTTLVSGVSGNIQRQIEGSYPGGMTIREYIDYVESQRPWEVAADLATPKPKNTIT